MRMRRLEAERGCVRRRIRLRVGRSEVGERGIMGVDMMSRVVMEKKSFDP